MLVVLLCPAGALLLVGVVPALLAWQRGAFGQALIQAALTLGASLLVATVIGAVSHSVLRSARALRRGTRGLAERWLPEVVEAAPEHGRTPVVRPVLRGQSLSSEDELGEVAESVDTMQRHVLRLAAQRAGLARQRGALHRERDTLLRQVNEARSQAAVFASQRDALLAERNALQAGLGSSFVNLSLRTLTLVERQLSLIEGLENREEDPDQLDNLFRLDHLATRMRRNSENLLILADADTAQPRHQPVSLLDVLRAGISEIESYQRVDIRFLPDVRLGGHCADSLAHLLAELLENATVYSAADADVTVSGWMFPASPDSPDEVGLPEVVLSIEDHGVGIAPEQLRELNEQLTPRHQGGVDTVSAPRSMGLFVVARLARRLGVRVQLRESPGQGVTAVVLLPGELLLGEEEADPAEALDPTLAAEDHMDLSFPTVASEVSLPGARQTEENRPGTAAPDLGDPGTAVPDAAVPDLGDPGTAAPDLAVPDLGDPGTAVPDAAAPDLGDPGTAAPDLAVPDAGVLGVTAPDLGAPDAGEGETADETSLPRRVPMAQHCPGSAEAPAVSLPRQQASEETVAPATPGDAAPGDASPPATAAAEELRRQLGGFQRGLRQARQRTADYGAPAPPQPAPSTLPGDERHEEGERQ